MILGDVHGTGSGATPIRPSGLVEQRCSRLLDHRPHGPYTRTLQDRDDDRDYWCPGGPPDALVMVAIANQNLSNARTDLDHVVLTARRAGASYAAIGTALGVSRQAAWERFHTLDEEAS